MSGNNLKWWAETVSSSHKTGASTFLSDMLYHSSWTTITYEISRSALRQCYQRNVITHHPSHGTWYADEILQSHAWLHGTFPQSLFLIIGSFPPTSYLCLHCVSFTPLFECSLRDSIFHAHLPLSASAGTSLITIEQYRQSKAKPLLLAVRSFTRLWITAQSLCLSASHSCTFSRWGGFSSICATRHSLISLFHIFLTNFDCLAYKPRGR